MKERKIRYLPGDLVRVIKPVPFEVNSICTVLSIDENKNSVLITLGNSGKTHLVPQKDIIPLPRAEKEYLDKNAVFHIGDSIVSSVGLHADVMGYKLFKDDKEYIIEYGLMNTWFDDEEPVTSNKFIFIMDPELFELEGSNKMSKKSSIVNGTKVWFDTTPESPYARGCIGYVLQVKEKTADVMVDIMLPNQTVSVENISDVPIGYLKSMEGYQQEFRVGDPVKLTTGEEGTITRSYYFGDLGDPEWYDVYQSSNGMTRLVNVKEIEFRHRNFPMDELDELIELTSSKEIEHPKEIHKTTKDLWREILNDPDYDKRTQREKVKLACKIAHEFGVDFITDICFMEKSDIDKVLDIREKVKQVQAGSFVKLNGTVVFVLERITTECKNDELEELDNQTLIRVVPIVDDPNGSSIVIDLDAGLRNGSIEVVEKLTHEQELIQSAFMSLPLSVRFGFRDTTTRKEFFR